MSADDELEPLKQLFDAMEELRVSGPDHEGLVWATFKACDGDGVSVKTGDDVLARRRRWGEAGGRYELALRYAPAWAAARKARDEVAARAYGRCPPVAYDTNVRLSDYDAGGRHRRFAPLAAARLPPETRLLNNLTSGDPLAASVSRSR